MRLRSFFFSLLIFVFLYIGTSFAAGQTNSHFNTPNELIPVDPEIRKLLGVGDDSCKAANPDAWVERVQRALQIAESRQLIGDRAIVETVLASSLISQGNIAQAFIVFRSALQDSIDSKREVLEADILVSLASEAQLKGDTQGAVELITKAIALSEKTGNLYGKARALGELGALRLQQNKYDDASSLIDEALQIDRLNKYKFEALHLVYRATYQGLVGKEELAIETLKQARLKAVEANDIHSFVSAENAYAFGLTRKGKADEAKRQMELIRNGNLAEFVPNEKDRECLTSSLALPVFHLAFLEGLTNVLEAANEKEREIPVWDEIFSISHGIGLLAGEAEAKQKIANIENQLKKTDEALKNYELAAELYRQIGNEVQLNQVEIAESLLLVNSGRGKEAISLVEDVVSYAKRIHLRELEFRAYITLGGIYQPAGEMNKAREAFEKAISLVQPGPFDSQIDNQAVHLVYVSLSDIYRKLAIPTKELISIDHAFFVSVRLKDEKAQQHEVAYLDQRINELRIRELADRSAKEGRLGESLIYSYILYLRDGMPVKPSEDPNWIRITSLPYQIAEKPEGIAQLTEIKRNLGSILGFEQFPVLQALARYYIGAGANPAEAEKYALEMEGFLKNPKGDAIALKVESSCILGIAYSRQGRNAEAQEKSAECLKLASNSHDERSLQYAETVDVIVQVTLGNIAPAKSSLEKLVATTPDNPEFVVELAESLASGKLYDEADSQLNLAVKKFSSAGNKKSAGDAYMRLCWVLAKDSTESSKTHLEAYLNAARKLYRESGATIEEAQTLVLIGDYFARLAQNRAAIDSYQKAKDLATRATQPNIVGQALFGLGNVQFAQKQFAVAAELHNQALVSFRQVNNHIGETLSLFNLGRDFYEIGDLEKALASLIDSRKAAETTGATNKYLADYYLGNFYRSQAQYEKAFAAFREAADITSREGDSEHCGYSHLAIASTAGLVGNWEDAIAETEIALRLFEKIGNKEGQASSWATLTGIYSDRTSSFKDFDKAEACYKKALNLGYGKTLDLDLMEIHLQTGKYSEAAKIAKESIRDCLKEKDASCRAHALISLSEAERLGGNLKNSRTALIEARPLVSKSSEVYLRGRLLYQESRLLASEGKLDEALASYLQVISLLENIKGKLETQEQKSISENYGFIYDELVSLLYAIYQKTSPDQLKLASTALEYAEKNKARQFAETWGRVFTNQMRSTLPAAIQEREQALYVKRGSLIARIEASDYSSESSKAMKPELEAELNSVQNEIGSLVQELRKISPQYAGIAYPENIQISSLPLRKSETLIEFKMTDDATFVWIVRNPDGTKNELSAFYKIPKKRTWFLERLSLLRKALNSGQPYAADWRISEELFSALFPENIIKVVENSPEVVLIPDDVLFILPFELLSPGASKGDYFFLRKPITYYPSVVSMRLRRTASPSSGWQSAFLGIADPITSPEDERFEATQALRSEDRKRSGQEAKAADTDAARGSSDPQRLRSRGYSFERIPGTAAELQSIVALLKERNESTDIRFGANATKAELLDTDLAKFRFVHFATHGVLPVDTGIQEPSLVLSYDGAKSENMFLSMSEIIGLKLQSESVVLSACNTGSGQISKAEGVMSLGRAFLAAGSASVTVSLWQVSDESTATLMTKYYQGLLDGKKKSMALAEARYAVFEKGAKNPFFWAPFIVIGE